MSGLLFLNNWETVENRGLEFPFADSSPKTGINSLKTAIDSLKSGLVSTFAADLTTSAQEGRGVPGVGVGARAAREVSWVGDNSEEGISSAGSGVIWNDVIGVVGNDVLGGDINAVGSGVAGSDLDVIGGGVVGSGVVGSDADGSLTRTH